MPARFALNYTLYMNSSAQHLWYCNVRTLEVITKAGLTEKAVVDG